MVGNKQKWLLGVSFWKFQVWFSDSEKIPSLVGKWRDVMSAILLDFFIIPTEYLNCGVLGKLHHMFFVFFPTYNQSDPKFTHFCWHPSPHHRRLHYILFQDMSWVGAFHDENLALNSNISWNKTLFGSNLHPRSLTARPWKMMVGRQAFPFGKAYFQGRTVKLQVGILLFSHHISQCWFFRILKGAKWWKKTRSRLWMLSNVTKPTDA